MYRIARIIRPLLLACAGLSAAILANNADALWRHPFAPDSIWNTRVGAGAVFVPTGIQPSYFRGVDNEILVRTAPTDPTQPVFTPGEFGPGRCTGTQQLGTLAVPDSLIVPDATRHTTPNNASAFLLPDGRTLVQLEPLARCVAGAAVYGWMWPPQDIAGDGIVGRHGGSSRSAIGGSIRLGELLGDSPIGNALKLELWAQHYY